MTEIQVTVTSATHLNRHSPLKPLRTKNTYRCTLPNGTAVVNTDKSELSSVVRRHVPDAKLVFVTQP